MKEPPKFLENHALFASNRQRFHSVIGGVTAERLSPLLRKRDQPSSPNFNAQIDTDFANLRKESKPRKNKQITSESFNIPRKNRHRNKYRFNKRSICQICLEQINLSRAVLNCSHDFCKDCMDCWVQNNNSSCPSCNVKIHQIKLFIGNILRKDKLISEHTKGKAREEIHPVSTKKERNFDTSKASKKVALVDKIRNIKIESSNSKSKSSKPKTRKRKTRNRKKAVSKNKKQKKQTKSRKKREKQIASKSHKEGSLLQSKGVKQEEKSTPISTKRNKSNESSFEVAHLPISESVPKKKSKSSQLTILNSLKISKILKPIKARIRRVSRKSKKSMSPKSLKPSKSSNPSNQPKLPNPKRKSSRISRRKKIIIESESEYPLSKKFESEASDADSFCYFCKDSEDPGEMLICDKCNQKCCHTFCLDPPIHSIPEENWFCDFCVLKYQIRHSVAISNCLVRNGSKLRRDRKHLGNRKQARINEEKKRKSTVTKGISFLETP